MSRNNIKLLTEEELSAFNDKYISTLVDGILLLSNRHYGRATFHDTHKSFKINSNIRSIMITEEAMNIWKELYLKDIDKREKRSIFDVQYAINLLYTTYQDINSKNVETVLRKNIKIK